MYLKEIRKLQNCTELHYKTANVMESCPCMVHFTVYIIVANLVM